jgi:hypothetical protein
MFRALMAGVLLLTFGAVGTLSSLHVSAAGRAAVDAGQTAQLRAARVAVGESRRLREHWLLALAEQVAATPGIGQILARRPEALAGPEGNLPDEETFRYEIHKAMNVEVAAHKARFDAVAAGQAPAPRGVAGARVESPDWFAVVDLAGVGVALATDKAWYGPSEADLGAQHPPLKAALAQGAAMTDLWEVKGAPMTVGIAPARLGDTVVGAVIIGHRLTVQEARLHAGLLGVDVGFFQGESFSRSTSLSAELEQSLSGALRSAGAMTGAPSAEPVEIVLGGKAWRAHVDLSAGYPSAPQAGSVVLVEAHGPRAEARAASAFVLALPGAAFVVALLALIGLHRRLMAPFEAIDRGVLEIISGKREDVEYWFDVPGLDLPGTLSQNLNVMVCHLTGRPLPEELEEQARGRGVERGA